MALLRCTLLFFFVLGTNSLAANLAVAIVDINRAPDGTIIFSARDATLGEVFKIIREDFKVEVKGLEDQAGKKISFSYNAETTEDLLKSLLRHLGVKNYALEFADATLNRLVVVPNATNAPSATTRSPPVISDQKEFAGVARIQSIVEGSQAESAGLQEGDLILEYDGIRINSAQQLVQEVEKKASNTQIEMLVVRQKIPSRLILNGGFIGVRVSTQNIPRDEFDAYQRAK